MSKPALFFFLLPVVWACKPRVEQSQIPNVEVNIELNLNDIDNAPLLLVGGYRYIEGGVRGIIVRRASQDTFQAFERNCPYRPQDSCAVVELHSSGFYFEDPCCGSTFDLSGFPTGGPAQFPLKQYSTSRQGDILYIFN